MNIRSFIPALLVAAVLCAPTVQGESYEPMANEILHSDLPIFGRGGDHEWPQHISDGESIGCTSRVAFGDWAFREHGDEDEEPASWYRFSNYGVFHCWANAYRAHERAGLDGAEHHPSFFVLLGSTRVDGREVELWTVQIGVRPGSQYLLLSRDPAEGLVDGFNVLQTQCPRGSVRDAGFLDSLITRYCAINSRGELAGLARRMAKIAPLGSLTLVPPEAIPSATVELPLARLGAAHDGSVVSVRGEFFTQSGADPLFHLCPDTKAAATYSSCIDLIVAEELRGSLPDQQATCVVATGTFLAFGADRVGLGNFYSDVGYIEINSVAACVRR